MHINQSDTTYDNVDHDEMLSNLADDFLGDYLMEKDLDLLTRNYANFTTSGHRCYVAALDA